MFASALLNPGGLMPPMDGRTPVFVELGADPRTSPGFDAPIGSICRFGTTYLVKFQAAATGWREAGGGDASVSPSGATSFDLSLPAHDGFWSFLGTLTASIAVASPVFRVNGATAAEQGFLYQNYNGAGAGSGVVAQSIGGLTSVGNTFTGRINAVGAAKLVSGEIMRANVAGDVVRDTWAARGSTAALLTSIGISVPAGSLTGTLIAWKERLL